MRTLLIVAAFLAIGLGSAVAAYELRSSDAPLRIEPIDLRPAPEPPERANRPKRTRPQAAPSGGAPPARRDPVPAGGSDAPNGATPPAPPAAPAPPPGGDDDGDDDDGDDGGDG